MPSVAWITYYWPDCQVGVTAAERNFELATGLARSGWDVTVVTRDGCEDCRFPCGPLRTPDGLEMVQLPSRWLRPTRWWEYYRWKVQEFPNTWRNAVAEWLEGHASEFDVLLVSVSPFPMIAAAVGRGRPVVVDFRDSLVPPMSWSLRRALLRYRRVGARRAVKRIDTAVHVTPDEQRRDSRVLDRARQVVVMSASAGPANVETDPPPVLTLAFAGTFVRGVNDPVAFLDALALATRALGLGDYDVRVELIGRQHEQVQQRARDAGVERMVRVRGHVSRDEVDAVYTGADVLLLLSGHEPGVPGSKLYEYLRRDQPILAFGGSDPWLGGLLADEKAGALVTTADGLETWLRAALAVKRAGSGSFPGFTSDRERADRHGWRTRVEQLDVHLREVIS